MRGGEGREGREGRTSRNAQIQSWQAYLTPCKIETFEQIDTQFVRIDYVHERNVCSKFGKKSIHGGLLGKGVKYNFLYDFFIYFSRTNVEKRPLDGF